MSRSRIAREFCLVTRCKMRMEDMLMLLNKEAKLRKERARIQGQTQVQGWIKNARCTVSPKYLVKTPQTGNLRVSHLI